MAGALWRDSARCGIPMCGQVWQCMARVLRLDVARTGDARNGLLRNGLVGISRLGVARQCSV